MTSRKLMRILVLLAALPLLLTSCSGSDGEADNLAATRERIIRTFKQETGEGFRRRAVSEDIRKWADLPRFELLEPLGGLLEGRYGYFTIYVYEDRQTRDNDMSGRGPADAQGRYWYEATPERGPHAGQTHRAAEKRYGDNVLLNWGPANERRDASEQWHRLDALLKRAVDG